MRLFIAEKPSLAKAIFEGLGGNPNTEKKNGYFEHGSDVVTWCYGHMLELYDPQDYDEKYSNWRFSDLPIKAVYPPKYKIKPESEAQTRIILSLIDQQTSFIVGVAKQPCESLLCLRCCADDKGGKHC